MSIFGFNERDMDGFAEVVLFFVAFAGIVIACARVASSNQRIAALERRILLLEAEARRMDAAKRWESTALKAPVPRSATAVNPVAPSASAAATSHVVDIAAADSMPAAASQPLHAPLRAATNPRIQNDLSDSLPASLFRIVAKNPLASAGVLLLLVGVGFLFALLAARNIMPPIVRIGLIASGGALLFGTGLRLEKKNAAVAFNLQGGAIAVEFLCGLWAYTGYHLLDATEAFFALGAISTLAYLWAAFKKGLPFAFIGLIGALVTPVVTSTGHGEFSSLVLYCLWIASLTICIADYLGSASLAPAALLGISVLLGVALGGNHGDAPLIVFGCSTMALAFALAGFVWARSEPAPTDKLRASVVTLLVFPSLAMASLIAAATNIDLADSALLAGAVGVLLLVGAWFKSEHWRVWLIMIGSMLTFVAIALHMHGAGQSVLLSAGALGLFMVANSMKTSAVRIAATLYWIVSSVGALNAISSGHTAPIYAAGLVALLAAHMERGGSLSIVLLIAAPLLAGAGVMHTFDGSAAHVLVFMLVWTVVVFGAAALLNWPQLLFSALWLLPAGAALMISPEWTGSTALWALREAVLAAWLALSTWLVKTAPQDTFKGKSSSYLWATQLIALCISIEVGQVCGPLGFDHKDSIFGALSLVWAISASLMVRVTASAERDSVINRAAAVALTVALLSVVITHFSAIDELLMIGGIALVVELHRRGRLTSSWLNATLLMSIGLLAAAGAILQFVGAREGLDQVVLALLVDERMQSAVSILWAAFGLVIVASGSKRAARSVWIVGAATLAALVVKMFVVDLASLGLSTKVGTFMLVGMLFIALGYFCPLPAWSSPADYRTGGIP